MLGGPIVALLLAAGGPIPAALGQDTGETASPPPSASTGKIRFTFKGASFEQVIDFFARSTGMPVIWETEVPEGTLDYLSPDEYDVPEALHVLNIILQSKGVMLRVDEGMLYLQKLSEMQREDIPTYVGTVPAEITGDQIITAVMPLNIAVAGPLAEKLASMVASYGSVTAMDQQNALVITETADQVRRILKIVSELDREDPEGAVEIIPIRHARAQAIMEPLKALLSKTVERIVMDKNNKPKNIQQQEMTGLAIAFDDRTNSIIAKGVQSRIDKLRQSIELLDVPASASGRSIRTFALARLAPGDAVTTLERLYQRMPEEERPTLLPLDDVGKLTIVGTTAAITEAALMLEEIDGSRVDADAGSDAIELIPLEHADPAALVRAVEGLLTRRQQAAVKILPGPDRHSIVVSGPASDVDSVRRLTGVLDRVGPVDRQVRMLRLTSPDPEATLRRARALFDREVAASERADDPRFALETELDSASRTLTLVGATPALDAFARALRSVETATVVARETRQIDVAHATPSRIAGPLTALAKQLLEPRDGTTFTPPAIEAVDAIDLLIVTAPSEQFAVIESLVETLDRPNPADYRFRVLPVTGIDRVDVLLERTHAAYDRLARGHDADDVPAPEIEHDELTGSLIVSGRAESVRLFEQALAEARNLLPPARSGRLIPLRQANASDVVDPLLSLWDKTAGLEAGRRTNSLYVVAEPAQHATVERLVRLLDTLEPTDLPPLRLLQVRAADSSQLATMLRRRYDQRPAEQRRERPVSIDADAATNTLIVTAHSEIFDEIREFVDTVNESEESGAERETMIFALRGARAVDLAAALDKLYPEPPMPLDRRGRPMPHLREPRDVYVSADAATNTLIVEAPAERRASFEALVEQLDRVELPPRAALRTYRIERGDPDIIARTLNELARRGVLSEQPADGSKPVEVLVQAEPRSRTLIVAGDDVTFEQTQEILADLEVVPVERSFRVFEVTGADPQTVADQAQRLCDE
jgi:type II secretory pathway component GspD/PulD (secretin)